jgi:hypothetical protein
MSEKHIYKVVFINQEQIYEVFVKNVYQGDLYGFVIVEDFVFGEKSAIVVDPTEEKLRIEFEGVYRSFIPVQRIIRIDHVKKRGKPKIEALTKDGLEAFNKVSALYPHDKK